MIELQNVHKVYAGKEKSVAALKEINLKVEPGDIFGVIGFSGAGKSTLIRTINFLERPSSGHVIVDNKELGSLTSKQLREARKRIGMIFQNFNLLDSKTVFKNVAIPLILNGTDKAQIAQRVHELLTFVGLEDKAHSYPSELSGGQKQRVGIARALATNPSVLLCDEATSALDPQTTASILQLLERINRQYNITILIITHEMQVIKNICNRVAVMENGKIIEQGNVLDVFGNPQAETTKNFVSTVIHDEAPPSILDSIRNAQGDSRFFKLKFIGNSAQKSLLFDIAKKFDVQVDILFATATEMQGTTLNNFMIELSGAEPEVEQAYHFMTKQHITVEEVMKYE